MAKKAYIGVNTPIPIYETTIGNVTINSSNMGDYFTQEDPGHYLYKWDASGRFKSTNQSINDTTSWIWLDAKVDMTLSFDWGVSSEQNYDKFTIELYNASGTLVGTLVDEVSGTQNGSCSVKLKTGERIDLFYKKDGSQESGEDSAWIENIVLGGVETQVITGYEYKDVARKVKKAYVGIDSTARHIKKGYIGIGGVARPFMSVGELAYYGTITPLNNVRSNLAATTIGDYALFGGGYSGTYKDTVDAYDTSLTRKTASVLEFARCDLAATSVGNYALFGGGKSYNGTASNAVDVYDTSLIHSLSSSNALSQARCNLSATAVGNYALFGGGMNGGGTACYTTVNAYDTSLTMSSPNPFTSQRAKLAATTVGDYALFGGGFYGSAIVTVNAYNKSLSRTTSTELSQARYDLAATTVGDYALFAGGINNSNISTSTVDVYDKSLTRTTITELSQNRYYLAATTVGDYALFGGGINNSDISTSTVDVYDKSLTRTTATDLSKTKYNLAATSVGDYALFGGGCITGYADLSDSVDAYTVA